MPRLTPPKTVRLATTALRVQLLLFLVIMDLTVQPRDSQRQLAYAMVATLAELKIGILLTTGL
jgi:hypothetical protein